MRNAYLSDSEESELYILLKPREATLAEPLRVLPRRIERSLYGRLTIEEIEGLSARFMEGNRDFPRARRYFEVRPGEGLVDR